MRFKAVIWDMDGLLIDSERVSCDSWEEAADTLGFEIEAAVFQSIIGLNGKAARALLENRIGHYVDVDRLMKMAKALYYDRTASGVPLKSGARACIEWLSNRGMPQSVATSTRQSMAKKKLGFHGLVERFHTIVGGDQVSNGKPHPEIYITAAEHMSLEPADCLVFEDSPNGVAAASASGATVILVPDIAIHDDESLGRATEVWESLDWGPKKFAEWFCDAKA